MGQESIKSHEDLVVYQREFGVCPTGTLRERSSEFGVVFFLTKESALQTPKI